MMKKKRIEQKILIKATPHEIYEIFMDSKKHSKLTESEAKISRKIGGQKILILPSRLPLNRLIMGPKYNLHKKTFPKVHVIKYKKDGIHFIGMNLKKCFLKEKSEM